ncbi:sigma-70 family RNA polymerase sigma factor [Botrimarina sp.]|uniref:RNA polymerase sigma factor n=1 Tax=Botrimarina sp. TaxID=2795802 RepID=UPI0032ED3DFE
MPERVDSAALGRLLAEHGPALALMAAYWTNSADDCVQEALIELASLPSAPDRPEAWLYRRVRQRALNAARAGGRRQKHEDEAWRERLARRGEADPAKAAELVDALAGLPPEERELVTLRFYSGLSYAEVAEALGASKSAVHRRTEAALERLRQLLQAPANKGDRPCRTTN